MVFRDLSKFAFLVVLMELPFVAALYFLESGDGRNEAFATFPDSALSFFKIVIGQGPDISSVTASSSVLLSIGSVLLSVLLLNLLIAMFSKTFDTIVENSTQEYLLQKAQLTFTWARAPRMPPFFAFALVLRDWAAGILARHWHNQIFREQLAGWNRVYNSDDFTYNIVEPNLVEPPPPTFDKKHFYEIIFPKKKDRKTKEEHAKNPAKREDWTAEWMRECEAKYEAWCEKVLADLEENAEFNSEAQMDKFKSRMLRGMETTVESSGKSATQEQVKSIQEQGKATQEQVKATQEQVKALSDAVQSQHAQIQQMHASMQLILQKLNP
jgi:flagellar capping protein FliD